MGNLYINKFGENLKRLRKGRKLTQLDISKIVNTDRSNVANYERGRRLPPIDSLIKIAEFFNVSLDELVLGKNEDVHLLSAHLQEALSGNESDILENEEQLRDVLKQKEDEINILREHINALKKLNNYLEDKNRDE